jgi:serine/threonine protein kinase
MGARPSIAQPDPPPPSEALSDNYEIEDTVGSGASGVVFRAKRKADGVKVAVKISRFESRRAFDAAAHIARVQETLRHEHIVETFETICGASSVVQVQELCDGGTLHDALKEIHRTGRSVRETRAACWLRQLCLAVDFIHRRGMIHRDIKSHNSERPHPPSPPLAGVTPHSLLNKRQTDR